MEATLSPVTIGARRTLSRIGLAYFAFFAATYAAMIPLTAILLSLAPALIEEPPMTWLLSLVPMYGFGLPAFILVLRTAPAAVPTERRLRLRHFFLLLLIAYAVMYVANLVGTGINSLTEATTGSSSSANATEMIESTPLLYTFLFAVILGPIVEELMFRRLVLSRLLPYGQKVAIVGSALLFALFHGNLAQILYAFAVGLILGYLYIGTGRLRYPILMHITLNFLGSIVPLLLLRAVDMERMEEIAAAEEMTTEMVAELLPSLLLLFAYIGLLLLLVVAGLILLIIYARRVRLAPAPEPIPRGERRYVFRSVGFILLVLTAAASFILSYL